VTPHIALFESLWVYSVGELSADILSGGLQGWDEEEKVERRSDTFYAAETRDSPHCLPLLPCWNLSSESLRIQPTLALWISVQALFSEYV
jgi:hypothetical protein